MFARAIHLDWLAESLANQSIKTGNRHPTALQKFDELEQISRFMLWDRGSLRFRFAGQLDFSSFHPYRMLFWLDM
jgi:hypothetical protein